MKNRPNGFTLIELLVVVAIVAILAALAIPSFNTMLMKRSVRSAALTLISDIRYARSEALRRSSTVSICSLAANSLNTCSAAGAANWANGWMVFWDTGTIGAVDGTDVIVRVQQPLTNIATVQGATPSSDRNILTFQANGRGRAIDQTFRFTPRGTVPYNTERTVCVSVQGRVRLMDEGTVSCS
ncbi:MAG: GspH/FimT family pseudopilin [Rhodoferax sp.]